MHHILIYNFIINRRYALQKNSKKILNIQFSNKFRRSFIWLWHWIYDFSSFKDLKFDVSSIFKVSFKSHLLRRKSERCLEGYAIEWHLSWLSEDASYVLSIISRAEGSIWKNAACKYKTLNTMSWLSMENLPCKYKSLNLVLLLRVENVTY